MNTPKGGCITCKHRHVYTEKAAKTRLVEVVNDSTGEVTYAVEEYDVKAILLPRCLADRVDLRKHKHPFGPEERGPILTCREMLLNGCRNYKLWEPIGDKPNGKANTGVARTNQRARDSGPPKPDQRLREQKVGETA